MPGRKYHFTYFIVIAVALLAMIPAGYMTVVFNVPQLIVQRG